MDRHIILNYLRTYAKPCIFPLLYSIDINGCNTFWPSRFECAWILSTKIYTHNILWRLITIYTLLQDTLYRAIYFHLLLTFLIIYNFTPYTLGADKTNPTSDFSKLIGGSISQSWFARIIASVVMTILKSNSPEKIKWPQMTRI